MVFSAFLICLNFGWCFSLIACLHTPTPKIFRVSFFGVPSLVIFHRLFLCKQLTTNLAIKWSLFSLPLCMQQECSICRKVYYFRLKVVICFCICLEVFHAVPFSASHDYASYRISDCNKRDTSKTTLQLEPVLAERR